MFELLIWLIKLPFVIIGFVLSVLFAVLGIVLGVLGAVLGPVLEGIGFLFSLALVLVILWVLFKAFGRKKPVYPQR